jgi:transposase
MALEIPESPPSPKTTVKEYERERRKNPTDVSKAGRIKHGPNATIIDVDVKNPEVEDIPEDQLELVETKTTQKVVRVSSPFMIVNVHSKIYRRKDDFEEIVPPEVPEVFENSIYDVSFLAGLAVDKYQFHLPLYRQHQTIKNADIFLDRGHLTRVLHRMAELLEPIYETLSSSVLSSKILTADETPTPAGRNKKKGKMDKGYFWAFFGDQKEIYYLFSPSRARAVLDDALASFQGHLVCDGYSAYDGVTTELGRTRVGCWTTRNFHSITILRSGASGFSHSGARTSYSPATSKAPRTSPSCRASSRLAACMASIHTNTSKISCSGFRRILPKTSTSYFLGTGSLRRTLRRQRHR